MIRPSRRTLLCSTATVIGLSAGCIADGSESPSDDDDDRNDADEGSPSPDGAESDPESVDEDGDEDLPDGVVDYRTLAYQYGSGSTESDVGLLRNADDAANWLEERFPSDTASLDEFVDETDFETSILVSLESDTPTPCYEIVLESIDIVERDGEDDTDTDGDDESDEGGDDDGTDELVLEAAVRDTSAEDEVCVQSIATVGRLVRVTFESEPLTTVSATIVGHDGSTSSVSMASDSASASESTSADSASGSGSAS